MSAAPAKADPLIKATLNAHAIVSFKCFILLSIVKPNGSKRLI